MFLFFVPMSASLPWNGMQTKGHNDPASREHPGRKQIEENLTIDFETI